MIADHMPEEKVPTIGGRKPFQVSGGTQALKRTVNFRLVVDDQEPVLISIPNALGALVLRGAAYREDSRDRGRHLDDAVVLCATIKTPLATPRKWAEATDPAFWHSTGLWKIRATAPGNCWMRQTGHPRWTRCAS